MTTASVLDGFGHARVYGPSSDSIDALFTDCDRPGRPGLAIAVIEHGRVIHARGYGLANVEEDVPFSAATVLHLGSASKHFCATCVLILEDRGLLDLGDSVRKHVPELPALADAMTLRHLLTMTSGLPDGLNAPLFSGLEAGLPQAQHFELLCRLPELMFAPGAGTTYSNSNYRLLSMVVERTAGMPLADFMRRELFEPLAMRSTALLSDTTLAIPGKARGYRVSAERVHVQSPVMDVCGDGGIVSSLADMILWAKAYLSGTVPVAHHRSRLELQARLPDNSPTGYALGMGVSSTLGLVKVSHGGGMPGYLADVAHFPDAQLSIVWMSNWMEPALFSKTDEIAQLVLRRSTPPSAGGSDLDTGTSLAGVYVNNSVGCTAEFEQDAGATIMHIMGERLVLQRTAPREYRPTKSSAYFPIRITERLRSTKPIVEVRLGTAVWEEFLPFVDDDAAHIDLREYEGRYCSEWLGEEHQLRLSAQGLAVTLGSATRRLLWGVLKARGADLFSAEIAGEPSDTDVSLKFQRDGNGRVCGFVYNLSRTRSLLFAKVRDRS